MPSGAIDHSAVFSSAHAIRLSVRVEVHAVGAPGRLSVHPNPILFMFLVYGLGLDKTCLTCTQLSEIVEIVTNY